MTNEELKTAIGSNIARLRRKNRLTQAELAERLNYSDKAVSKWERAESMPDVLTLVQLAEQLGTDVNTLLSDPGARVVPESPAEQTPPEQPETAETAAEPEQPAEDSAASVKRLVRVADKNVIQKLSSILVWVVALFIYIVLDSFGVKNGWMVFVLAVIANAIVLLSLRSAWKLYGMNRILISVIMWTTLLLFFLTVWLIWNVSVWRVFLLGVLGQIAIILWFRMFRMEEAQEGNDNE